MFLSTLFPNSQVPNTLQDNDYYVTYSLFTQLTLRNLLELNI